MSASTSSQRAQRLIAKGQLDQALRELEELHGAAPDDERLTERLAALLEARGRRDEGRGRAESAAADLGRAAELLATQGRFGAALRAARGAAQLDPATRDRVALLRRQRALRAARDVGLALLSGLLPLLAVSARGLWPLALGGLAPLLLAARRRPPLAALGLGWLSGLVVNLGGNLWGVELLERFAHMSAAVAGAALLGVCAYQASVFALWLAGVRLLARWLRLPVVLTAPLLMVLSEALVPFLFPWYLGVVLWRAWPLVQVAELGGPLAVSALLVLVNAVAFEAGAAAWRRRRPGRPVLVAAVTAAALVALGLGRAAQVAAQRRRAEVLRVGVVQPNFGIMSPELRKTHGQAYIDTLRRATEQAGAGGARLVVWPESAFPFLFDRQLDREYARGHPWALRGDYGGRLLFGALSHPFGEAYIFNSAALVASDGALAGTYDKNRLLVFGEYVPLRDRYPHWARRVRARLPDWPDIEPGRQSKVLVDGALRVLPLICYEDILPGYVHAAVRRGRPNLLVTLANHAWFGDGAAPRLALALASLRAVETRRDLVRATNTGVSSFTDALGRVLLAGPLYDVPRDRPREPQVFVRDVRLLSGFALGPYTAPLFPWACGVALVAAVAAAWRRRRRES